MISKKILRGILATAVLAGSLFLPSMTSAEIKTYTGVGEYIMSDFETIDVAKQRAKMYAERNAQEQAGVYVSSYTRTENFALAEDEVVTMTSGILSVSNVEYEMIQMKEYGGVMYRATIQASIDTDKVDEWISKGVSERSSLVEKNQELQRAIDAQEKQIAELKKQIGKTKTPQAEEQLKQDFAEADKIFMSNVKLEEGNRLNLVISDWAYAEAVKCWSEAIELNPKNFLAYEARGYYFNLSSVGEYKKAIDDFANAIKLHPVAENYFYRGTAYLSTGQVESATKDFEQAVKLDPNMSAPYGELAYIYAVDGNANKAIRFADKAIEFDSRNWRAFYSRGLAKFSQNRFESALEDAQTALELGCGDAYQLIGDCYGKLGMTDKAEEYWELAKNPPAFG